MNENNISTLNTKQIKVKKTKRINFSLLSLKKWRGLFLGLIKYPCAQRRPENTAKNNLPQSSIAKEITPWDDDESKLFPN